MRTELEGVCGGVCLVNIFAMGKVSRSSFLSVDYILRNVNNNQDFHRIRDPVNIWKSSLCSFYIL